MRTRLLTVLAVCFSGIFFVQSAVAQGGTKETTPPHDLAVTEDGFVEAVAFPPLRVTDKYTKAYLLSVKLLEGHHYRDEETLPELSADVFDDYLDSLDASRMYFLQSDVDELSQYRNKMLTPPDAQRIRDAFDIFERYRLRAAAMNQWTLHRLQKPFNLKGRGSVYIQPYHLENTRDWPQTLDEATAYQEQRLTDQIIRQMLSGKSEEEAVAALTQRYGNANKRLGQMTSDDVFDLFMNVFSTRFDPHTNYLSPRDIEDFDINMRLSLEGIGAVLGVDDEKITVRQLTPGGPAAKSGKLHIRDQIIGVAQGKDGEMVDVVGWRLDKAIKLIRGKKGSLVRLLIEPSNNKQGIREITIQREEIKLEEQGAQGFVEEVSHDGISKKIGVIRLPSFYMDFDGAQQGKKDYRSTSKDVRRLLGELQDDGVQGIIIDLRGNGGGSLYEVVQTVGLFIDEGPVVSVSSADGEVREELDEDSGTVYSGPLAVMIDHYSASASEIFAAAIQDYQRGLIIGSNSFGKGTVQTMIDLNRFVPKDDVALGKLKFTVSMFHRVTGGSTQLQGVSPDVTLPEGLGLDVVGERAEPHALGWKQVRPSHFKPTGDVNASILETVVRQHQQRMNTDPIMQRYQEYVSKVTEESNKSQWSLNLAERRQDYDDWDRYSKAYEAAQREETPALASDAKRKRDITERNQYAKDENDKEHFVPDVALYEALNIFYDYLVALQMFGQQKAA